MEDEKEIYLWEKTFRKIGHLLLEEITPMAGSKEASRFLERGASGDKTFLIDRVAEDIVVASLKEMEEKGFSFTLISEECGIKKFGTEESDINILLDPLDGSNNAKRGIPCFSTSIALLKGDTLRDLRVGYVINLSSGAEYMAIKNRGAWRNQRRLRCNGETKEIDMLAFEASVPGRDLVKILPVLKRARKIRCFGSIAIDLALIASGAIDILLIATPSRSFDFAAGLLILQEAGGVLTDMEGNDIGHLPPGLGVTRPLLAAANPDLHRRVLNILNG